MRIQNPGKLIVRNVEQQAAFLELDGQISDGYWENTPGDSWRQWTACDVVVARQGELCGRTFYVRKDNYNLTAKDLLDVVGKRMLGIIRIARACGIEVARILEHAVDCETGRIDWTASWNADRLGELTKNNVIAEMIDNALKSEAYTFKHMLVDLQDLKAIMKMKLDDKAEAEVL